MYILFRISLKIFYGKTEHTHKRRKKISKNFSVFAFHFKLM